MAIGRFRRIGRWLLKLPIHVYRYTLKAWFGWPCRHLPTCSEYALEAIDKNGATRGFWLMIARLSRCHPWGSAGFDPVPDIREERFFWQPWKYGRWSGQHIKVHWRNAGEQRGARED